MSESTDPSHVPIRINDWQDPRVAVFANLPRSGSDRRLHHDGVFVCEGRWVTHRMLDSNVNPVAVLAREDLAPEFVQAAGGRCPVYQMDKPAMDHLMGFEFHRGVIACGTRPAIPNADDFDRIRGRGLVVLDQIHTAENVGMILRSCAAFGIQDVWIGGGTIDPMRRRVTRVSMGAVFAQRFFHTTTVAADLDQLRKRLDVTILATSLDKTADSIRGYEVPARRPQVLVLGNEAEGVAEQTQRIADRCLSIPMAPGVDSLNVAAAASIFLQHLFGVD
ncbi:TrmH family RNA methyltransferase [Crateriforma conspicua]|uniref:23S rRNA (Guanosine-2'-O-)-methyltransferase RlmB n=1 Tax=Crateriforma conspicua TaxID=2527996 RepID=A0A5C5XSS9_9PLAN|nr:RNA methyltransferase [Crateriforma conspicua]TWT65728.1 23S rRNA (guanosine-2'-O-)-methyltransferase RlmB [Crateriforma conspicua]